MLNVFYYLFRYGPEFLTSVAIESKCHWPPNVAEMTGRRPAHCLDGTVGAG
jgi:hypothetical protein